MVVYRWIETQKPPIPLPYLSYKDFGVWSLRVRDLEVFGLGLGFWGKGQGLMSGIRHDFSGVLLVVAPCRIILSLYSSIPNTKIQSYSQLRV